MTTKANYGKVNGRDLAKGLFVAVITALLSTLAVSLEDGSLPTLSEWRDLGLTALVAGISYIVKNLLTNSDDELLKKENPANNFYNNHN